MTKETALHFSLEDLARDVRYACLLGPATSNKEVLDPYGFISQPAIIRRLGAWISDLLQVETTRLVGVGASALPIALAAGLELNMPVAFVEEGEFRGELAPGDRTAVIADITRTGITAIGAINAIEGGGAEVAEVFVVWDRGHGGVEDLRDLDGPVHVLIEDRP